ncbi:MAG TPA: hypothetical protein VF702_12620 [Allosphingosinicella sp.]|jgi:hypothetical protein
MAIETPVEQFLSRVEAAAGNRSGLRAGDTIIPLVHAFWSSEEVAKSLKIKGEWDVPGDLIPFYGDWHDLLCISPRAGKVLMLDDARSLVFAWESGDDFLACLTRHPDMEEGLVTNEDSGVVSGRLDF